MACFLPCLGKKAHFTPAIVPKIMASEGLPKGVFIFISFYWIIP